HLLKGFFQNRSQIRLDYSEFFGEHRNVHREIIDHLPGGLPLLHGYSGDPVRGFGRAIRRMEASSITRADLLATTGCRAPCGWQRWSSPVRFGLALAGLGSGYPPHHERVPLAS